MRKVFFLALLGLCLAVTVHGVSNVSPGSNKPAANAPIPATKSIGNQNMPQVIKEGPSPSVTVNKPNQNEVWEAGKSYPVEWETRLLSPDSSGTVMLTVMVPTASNCQPITGIPLSGQISYPVPFASGGLAGSPHGKFMATLSVKFIDKVTKKEHKDGKVIFVAYP
jgi:hypothetical protein